MERTDLSVADDATLMALVVQRDQEALRELYNRYGGVVTGLARRILGDVSLAEDITQDVFVHLWRTAERFNAERGKLRTMLLTQTHGKCVDLIRARNARSAREAKVHTQDDSTQSDAVDAELMAITETELIRAAVTRLPVEERTVLELAYFGGNTYRQVATLLDLPEGTVKGRIRSGLRRLHEYLAEPFGRSEHTPPNQVPPRTTPQTAPTASSLRKDSPWTAS
jgi:RNA polymerase sigma-70 factor, ECF subfamily